MQKYNFFVKQFFFQDEVEILTFLDVDDYFGDDDEDEYRCNSVNFQARTSRFCMEVDLDNIEQMMMIMMIIAVIQSIFKLGPLDFAWNQIQIIPLIY